MNQPLPPSLDVEQATLQLLAYCRGQNWAGHDPYDALNSRWLETFPFLDSKLPRLVLTQALKRSPVNLRPLLLIPKTQNPKALALFLSALLKLSRLGVVKDSSLVPALLERLEALRSKGTDFWCWGYSFPWQTRTILVPRFTPNLVCTTFVANTLLDLYEAGRDARHLGMAVSAAEYILRDLYWTSEGAVAGFSYPLPSVRAQVHNANILAAALFARVAAHSGEKKFIEPAMKAARHSAGQQRSDGSWLYGELPTQGWVDNFHTGYNLTGLRVLGEQAGTSEFDPHVRRGYEFYRKHFFREDGAARYFHDRTYPIDIHCVAQSIMTPVEFSHLDPGGVALSESVYSWAVANMRDARGFFYYRKLQFCTIKTDYMRWSQAWMLLALTTLLEKRVTAARGGKDTSTVPAVSR